MNSRNRGSFVPATCMIVLLLAAAPRLPGSGAEEAGRGKLWLEFSGGLQVLDPADLNLAVDADNRVQYLRYDHYLEYLRSNGQIRLWGGTASGERRRVGAGWALEPRLRYQLGRSLALSAGLRVMRGGRGRELHFEFIRDLGDRDQYVENLVFSPYSLEVQSCWPSLGIHVRRRLGRRFLAEGYAAAGPLFASASYRSAWTYAWEMRGSDYNWPVFRDAGERAENGSGTGIGLELGARIGRDLGSRLTIFLEGGYDWQRVNSISGSGKEIRAGLEETWSGKWVTRAETLAAPWEILAIRFPTSRPQAGADDRPFRLDLSGWRLRAGISWKL